MVRKFSMVALILVVASCSEISDFRKAENLVQNRKFYNAMEYYLSFVYKHPNHSEAPRALFEVGNIQQTMLGELDKSVLTYRKLVDNYPINQYTIQAQRRIGDIYKNNYSNYRQALSEYDKFIRAVPDDKDAPNVQFDIADCYTLLHQYEQANLEYVTLISRYSSYEKMENVMIKKADNEYIWAKYENAIEDYKHALAQFPNSKFKTDILFGIASSYDELDDFDQAEKYYKQVIDEYPSRKVVEIRIDGLHKRKQKKSYIDTHL